MVTSCSAFGCTYRHKKGDNIGLYRFPSKDQNLCLRWAMAVRRVNWKPNSTSRICGKHFQTGKPSKDENHPDYVPNVFVFNQNQNRKEHWQKVAEEKASQRVAEIIHGSPKKVDITGYRQLKPKLSGYGVPFVVKARKADKQQPINPAVQSCHISTMMKNNNSENKKAHIASDSNELILFHKEEKPSVPQGVWVLNFDPEKNSNESDEKPKEIKSRTATFTTLKKNLPSPISQSCLMIYEDSEPTISDDSTLTAESNTEDNDLSMAVSKNVSNDASDNVSFTLANSVTEDSTDSDYSEFKSTPFDTKEVLAIKLETMLAVNISLKQKVEFYQNKCKQHETEISNLRNIIKKTKTGAISIS